MSAIEKILEGTPVREALKNSIMESSVPLKISLFDFTKLEMKGGMFILVDATKQGYLGKPLDFVLMEGDKNAVRDSYGDYLVVGYEAYRNKMMVFIKPYTD